MQLCTIASVTTVVLVAKQTLQGRFRHKAVYALCQYCFQKERWVIFVGVLSEKNRRPNVETESVSQGSLHFPGTQGKDVKRKLPTLVQPSGFYPLLVFQLGSNEVPKKGRSSLTNLISSCGRVTPLVDEGYSISGCSLPGLSKVFDTISHSILLEKLAAHHLEKCNVCWVENWMAEPKERW